MQKQDRPVAFFDSGLGGISVLRETVRLLPQENYLYYGDSLHAPYGVKSEAQIQALSLAAAEHLVSAGAKAIVVACNTATSAAIGLPCEGLMEFVERGELRGSAVEAYLAEKLAPYLREPVDGIVLGCTHYPFLTGAIRRIVGPGPEIMDGSHGVAMQLARKLAENGMLRSSDAPGTAVFENSLDEPEILALSRALFRYQDE